MRDNARQFANYISVALAVALSVDIRYMMIILANIRIFISFWAVY